MWPQAQDLLQHGTKIGLLMTRVVRVVVADTFPKIAMRLVETLTQNPGAGLQISAEIVAQRTIGAILRRRPVRRHLRYPDLVDLHRPDIDGAVGILADGAERASLDVDEDHKNGGWNTIGAGGCLEAALDGDAVACVGRPCRVGGEQQ